jgi:hypothetical protein
VTATIQPTLAGFVSFCRTIVGITTDQLPDSSPYFGWAFAVALAIVNPALASVPIPSVDSVGAELNAGGFSIYSQAVFNLAADNLFNFAQDPPGAPLVPGSGDPKSGDPEGLPLFQFSRKKWNINGFVSGVIDASGDETTNQHLVVQEAAKNFTLANLQSLKTPYGRAYLAFAQTFGPTTWGMT